MIPKECKRLAEVDFPIAVVSKNAVRETYLRQGHPKSLHLWWARRPLAACRAILLSLLIPDPCDELCPKQFNIEARRLLAPLPIALEPDDDGLRKALLKFIGDFSDWDLSNNSLYVEIARSLVKAAHDEEVPLVVDPFAGGGSIPLEALSLGCETFASDLNPVACLMLKVLLEDIPRNGPELGKELSRVGKEIKEAAERELKKFYPDDPDGSKPITYIWARSIKCEAPNCGAEIPLVRSFWLCRKGNRRYALRYKVVYPTISSRNVPFETKGKMPYLEFEIFEPRTDQEVPLGTVRNGRATCPVCNTVISGARLQAQLKEQHGGADNSMLLAVIILKNQSPMLEYRVGAERDYQIVENARKYLAEMIRSGSFGPDLTEGLSSIRPSPNARGVSAPTRYGATQFKDLFLSRQRLSLMMFSKLISSTTMSQGMRRLLALALDKVVMKCNAHCRWLPTGESLADLFGRHAIAMVWDFAESNPIGVRGTNLEHIFDQIQEVIASIYSKVSIKGEVSAEDACSLPLPDQSTNVWFTDPPYYDNIPYADLSDFFYVWMKRTLSEKTFFKSELAPKEKEAVWNIAHIVNGVPKGPEFFENSIAKACEEGRRVITDSGIGCVVFAHKTTEGWEALLSGMIDSGWLITASWPLATEMPTRVSAKDSASLATSIHLVCRPRPDDAPVGDWSNVIKELPARVGTWMERLQKEGIRGADLVFACIGPALEIYSRYSKVVDAEDRDIPLGGDPIAVEPHKRGYLAYVWEAVGKAALEQVLGASEAEARNSASGALEEDARLTALFLWTLQSTNGNGEIKRKKVKGKSAEDEDGKIGEVEEDEDESAFRAKSKGFSLIFDVVRRFAQPLGIRLPDWEGRIIETEKGIVRLLSVKERSKQLFGDAGAQAVADQLEESTPRAMQLRLFPREAEGSIPKIQGRGGKRSRRFGADVSDEDLRSRKEATTLDRVHAAMLLQAGGRANALRALLKAEVERGPDFLRLANALSALYPKTSEEKRLLDAMLLAVPR
jgi:putative DNA methylase